jgi:DNA mismatch repair protein MutS2
MSGDLVLVDEIGTGTDPQEGSALAMAVLEDLTSRGVMTVVTTHHGALKAFAHETPAIANGSMAFDAATLAPTYQFRADVPGSSYAFEIAQRLGLPDAVIDRSRSLIGSQASHLEELVQELGEQIDQNRRLKKELEAQKATVARHRRQYETDMAQLKKDTKAIRQQAVEEARAIVKSANAAVEQAIRTIREEGASKEAIREAKALMEEQKAALSSQLEPPLPATASLTKGCQEDGFPPGSQVAWGRHRMVGTVLDGEDPNGRVLVAFDKLKAHVPKQELNTTDMTDRPSAGGVTALNVPVPRNVKTELDIRGMRVEEALDVVDKFLDDSALAGLKEVKIIHGVGTGALKKSLAPFLHTHPHVLASTGGDTARANPGVTIVTIGGP